MTESGVNRMCADVSCLPGVEMEQMHMCAHVFICDVSVCACVCVIFVCTCVLYLCAHAYIFVCTCVMYVMYLCAQVYVLYLCAHVYALYLCVHVLHISIYSCWEGHPRVMSHMISEKTVWSIHYIVASVEGSEWDSVIPQYLLMTSCISRAGLTHGRPKLREGRVSPYMELAVSAGLLQIWGTRRAEGLCRSCLTAPALNVCKVVWIIGPSSWGACG